MSEVLSKLGGMLSGGGDSGGSPNWLKLLLGGVAGTGEVGNILADRQRGAVLSNLEKQQKAFQSLTPEQLSGKVSAATKPLDAGLVQAVTNLVQGDIGERGLSQAPGIRSAVLAQALAPYYQRNQDTALQEIMQQAGMPISAASAEGGLLPGMTNLSPILALLLKSLGKGGNFSAGGTASPLPPTPATPTNSGDLAGILQSIVSDTGSDMPSLGS